MLARSRYCYIQHVSTHIVLDTWTWTHGYEWHGHMDMDTDTWGHGQLGVMCAQRKAQTASGHMLRHSAHALRRTRTLRTRASGPSDSGTSSARERPSVSLGTQQPWGGRLCVRRPRQCLEASKGRRAVSTCMRAGGNTCGAINRGVVLARATACACSGEAAAHHSVSTARRA